MDLPKGKSTVGCKWVLTTKYNYDGSLVICKARLVAKGLLRSMWLTTQKHSPQ